MSSESYKLLLTGLCAQYPDAPYSVSYHQVSKDNDLLTLANALEQELRAEDGGEVCEYHQMILQAYRACAKKMRAGEGVKYYKAYLMKLMDYFTQPIPTPTAMYETLMNPNSGEEPQDSLSIAPLEVQQDIVEIHGQLYTKSYLYNNQKTIAIKHILHEYDQLNTKGAGKTPSLWQKFYKGYFYKGEYETQSIINTKQSHNTNQALIKLIESIAQRNPQSIKQLKLKMATPNYNLISFADDIAAVFLAIQNGYLEQLKAYDLLIVRGLAEFYFPQNPQVNVIKHIYDKILKDEDLTAEDEALFPVTGWLKLVYDIRRVKSQVLAYRNYIGQKQIGKLKEEINITFDALGLSQKRLMEVESNSEIIPTYAFTVDQESNVFYKKNDQQTRRIIMRNQWLAWIFSIVLGIGEGFVAALGILPLVVLTSALGITLLAIVWGCGALSNYALTVKDSEDVFNTFSLGKLFINEKGEKISPVRKWMLVLFALIPSCITGIGYGALSFMSVNSIVLQSISSAITFGGAWKTLIMVGCYTVFAIPPIATAIGLGCIFYVTVSDFIKNGEDRWASIKKYFRETYGAPLIQMTDLEITGQVFIYLLEFAKLLIALSVIMLITVATFGVMYKSGLEILKNILAANLIGGMTTAINSIFSIEKVVFLFRPLCWQMIINFTMKAVYLLSGIGILASFGITIYNQYKQQNISWLIPLDTWIKHHIRGDTFSGIDTRLNESKPLTENAVVEFTLKALCVVTVVIPFFNWIYNVFTAQDVSVFKAIDRLIAKPVSDKNPLVVANAEVNQITQEILVDASGANSAGQGSLMGDFGNTPLSFSSVGGAISTFCASFGPILFAIKKMMYDNDVVVTETPVQLMVNRKDGLFKSPAIQPMATATTDNVDDYQMMYESGM